MVPMVRRIDRTPAAPVVDGSLTISALVLVKDSLDLSGKEPSRRYEKKQTIKLQRTGGFLLALHFGDFQRREPEIHCADDSVHLL
jgi:hypothetical protein